MGTAVNIDGNITGPEDAFISVFDRGFLYGDSVYEVIRTYGGDPYELSAHIQRLQKSAELISLTVPWSKERIEEEIYRTNQAADNLSISRETYIRSVVTRGSGEIGLDPALAENPRIILVARPLQIPPIEFYRQGIEVSIVGIQRVSQEAVNPAAKTGNYLNNLLALKEAKDRGAYEAIMLDAHGRVTEGSTSNIFIVSDGVLKTPPREAGILEGVTRRTVLRLADGLGIETEEVHLFPTDLRNADEAFITSTIREMLPVTSCDKNPIGDGRVGSVVKRIQVAWRQSAGKPVDGGGF